MSRRGRSGPTISLFSFQDIITSVTAIVTVVTLLLALDLVQRKQAKSSDTSESTATDLAARVSEMELEISLLQSSMLASAGIAQAIAETTPTQLKNELIAKRASLDDLKSREARLEDQIAEWKRREKQELATQFDQQPQKDQRQATLESIAKLEQEIAKVESDDRVVYHMQHGSAKSGWIATVEANSIAVAPIGRRSRPTWFGVRGAGGSASDSFFAWIKSQKLERDYFFFLVRPEGIREYSKIDEKWQDSGISRGFDLIDFDEVVLDPERGASR